MKCTWICLFVAAITASSTGAEEKIQGTWQAMVVKCNGQDCEIAKGLQCIFTKDKISARYGNVNVNVAYKVDAEKAFSVVKDGVVLWKGIYLLEGDRLKICVVGPDGKAPDAFQTKEGDARVLVVLERVAAKP